MYSYKEFFYFIFLQVSKTQGLKLMQYLGHVILQLITNPDMLHVSIMPSHRQFTRFLTNLK